MSSNDAYAILGGGALDQELFKKKQTPLAVPDERKTEIQEKPIIESPTLAAVKPLKRKQISAYLSPEQVQTLKSLHFTLNNNLTSDSEIEKSDIVALGIECVSLLLGTQVPKYSNTQELRAALLETLSKYLGTQVPEI